jgi:hypothetical protein
MCHGLVSISERWYLSQCQVTLLDEYNKLANPSDLLCNRPREPEARVAIRTMVFITMLGHIFRWL